MLNELYANSIEFFKEKEINYFKKEVPKQELKPKEVKKELPKTVLTKKKTVKKSQFDWEKVMDVEDDEFFREGEHLPPHVVMEVSRRPTDKNIKNYLDYFKLKNLVRQRTQLAIEDYLRRKSPSPETVKRFTKVKQELPEIDPDGVNYRVVMFFRADCPFCKKMFGTLSELSKMGYLVEARQVDRQPLRFNSLGVPIVAATKEDMANLTKLKVSGVPFTIIKKRDGKGITLSQYQDTQTVVENIQKLKTL